MVLDDINRESSVRGTTVTGTVLAATEFCNFKCDRYNVNPVNTQNKCAGCTQTVLVRNDLRCPNCYLIITCHNEIYDDIIHLTKQDFYPKCVHGKPLIHLGCSRYEEEVRRGGILTETRGDVSIRGQWEIQKSAIIDVRFGDSDTETWKPVIMNNFLKSWEKTNQN